MKESSTESDLFGGFQNSLKTIFDETLSQKTKQIDQREKLVSEREAKLAHFDKELQKIKGKIKLQVGSVIYHTTASTLLKYKDSYFHGLLNPNFKLSDGDILFIDRDGEVFKYVLEYLMYGKLISVIDIGMLQKLLVDADYYILPELVKETKEQINLQPPRVGGTFPWCRFSNGSCSGNGAYWSWNTTDSIDSQFFQLTTVTYQNDTLKILQPGIYHIIIRTTCTTAVNYYAALYLNSSEVARCYASSATALNTFHINEVRKLAKGDSLQVYQTYNNSPQNGNPYNLFEFIRLGD